MIMTLSSERAGEPSVFRDESVMIIAGGVGQSPATAWTSASCR
jgi:hypothetical protein